MLKLEPEKKPIEPLAIKRIFDYEKTHVLQPSFQLEMVMRAASQRVNTLICHGIEDWFATLDSIFEMYDILALKGELFLSSYSPKGEPLILNPAFMSVTRYDEEEFRDFIRQGRSMAHLLYEGKDLEKVEKYVKALKERRYAGYRNIVFRLKDKNGEYHDILWSNFNLADGTNIRVGSSAPAEYQAFFRPELIPVENTDYSDIFLVTRQVDTIAHKMLTQFQEKKNAWYAKNDAFTLPGRVETVIRQARLMAISIDFLMQEGSVPITIYEKTKPVFLNNAFLKLTGYSREDIDTYYKRHGEVATLFYKDADLVDVQTKLAAIQGKEHDGYKWIEFTMTRNPNAELFPGERVTLAWTTYNWQDKTIRSARFVRKELT